MINRPCDIDGTNGHIQMIGYMHVSYNDQNRIEKIGNNWVEYNNQGRITKVGYLNVQYNYNGRLELIGHDHVQYNYDGLIERVGTNHVKYHDQSNKKNVEWNGNRYFFTDVYPAQDRGTTVARKSKSQVASHAKLFKATPMKTTETGFDITGCCTIL